jgi:hypothetical protein
LRLYGKLSESLYSRSLITCEADWRVGGGICFSISDCKLGYESIKPLTRSTKVDLSKVSVGQLLLSKVYALRVVVICGALPRSLLTDKCFSISIFDLLLLLSADFALVSVRILDCNALPKSNDGSAEDGDSAISSSSEIRRLRPNNREH